MIKRRRLHKLFDAIKCDFKSTVVEKLGFASEKNLVIKECFVSLDQLRHLKTGQLLKRVE